MHIKNIFDEPIEVTDLELAIKEANQCLGFARNAAKEKQYPVQFVNRGDKQVTLSSYHSHNLNELLKLLPPLEYPEWLLVCGFVTCYSYCDKRKEVNRDYKTILRLYYNPLRIEITAANKKAYPEIVALAAEHLKRLQARVNEPLVVTASGQTTSIAVSDGPDIVIVKR